MIADAAMRQRGLVQATADELGINEPTLCRWRNESREVRDIFRRAREGLIDLAERGMNRLLQDPLHFPQSVHFALRTHGKLRGWGDSLTSGATIDGRSFGVKRPDDVAVESPDETPITGEESPQEAGGAT
jgi:UTP-glucose-1-phosphate uridylyltransferase